MKAEDISQVTLLGAGMIGHTLALHFAKAGYQVRLFSRTQQTLDRALSSVR
jgi:3-hydroxybutyryl-CoA dehydrogenase